MTVEPLRPGDPPAIGAYELLGRLGAGGMGQVFLGRGRDGHRAAVKIVREDLARQAEFRRRFRAEVRAAQRVGGMWTAPVLGWDTESDVPWVATAYVTGAPLQTVVDSLHARPLPERSVWALAHGLGQALTTIHAAGLIHRDLKPSNVMVSSEGPKVIDFGIARAVDSGTKLTRTGQPLGTPGYMAPEQVSGEVLTGAVDVFALGAVLAYAATGVAPFSWDGAGAHVVLYRVMHHAPQIGPGNGPLHGMLRELVVRCLDKEPSGRPTLPEILSLARAGAGTGHWLPPALAQLLEREDAVPPPEARAPAPAQAPPPPGPGAPDGPPPVVRHDQTTYAPAGSGLPASSGTLPYAAAPAEGVPPAAPDTPSLWTSWNTSRVRRRRRYTIGAVSVVTAAAVAVGGWLALDALRTDASSGGSPGPSRSPLVVGVPQEVRDAGGLTVHVSNLDAHEVLSTEGEGPPSGFEVDLVEAVGKRLGVHVDYSESEDNDDVAPDAVKAARKSPGHIAMADLPDNPENREKWGVDMVDHFRSGLGVVAPTKYDSLSEVCGLTIATYTDDDIQNQITDEADCSRPLDFLPKGHKEDMVEAVMSGAADVVVLQYPLAAEAALDAQQEELTVSLVRDARGPRGIAVPAGQPELRDAVATALKSLVADGTYERLLKRWGLLTAAVDEVRVNGGG